MRTSREFSRWFEVQYGPRPGRLPWEKLLEKKQSAEIEFRKWQSLVAVTNEWDAHYELALTAWQASRSKGKKKGK